jgi:hypothetical protein
VTIWLPVSLASVLLVQSVASPPSPSRPDFAGTWRLDPSRSESAASSDSAEPRFVEITQSDRDVTIDTTQGARHNRTVHPLVATPSAPFSIEGAGGRAYWQGASLVTEGTRLVQGQTVAARETRTLNPDGTEMTVEVVVIVQHGYEFRGARNYGTGRDVYTKVVK